MCEKGVKLQNLNTALNNLTDLLVLNLKIYTYTLCFHDSVTPNQCWIIFYIRQIRHIEFMWYRPPYHVNVFLKTIFFPPIVSMLCNTVTVDDETEQI